MSASGLQQAFVQQNPYLCLTLSLFLAAATLAAGCCALLRSLTGTALLSDDSSLGTCARPAQPRATLLGSMLAGATCEHAV